MKTSFHCFGTAMFALMLSCGVTPKESSDTSHYGSYNQNKLTARVPTHIELIATPDENCGYDCHYNQIDGWEGNNSYKQEPKMDGWEGYNSYKQSGSSVTFHNRLGGKKCDISITDNKTRRKGISKRTFDNPEQAIKRYNDNDYLLVYIPEFVQTKECKFSFGYINVNNIGNINDIYEALRAKAPIHKEETRTHTKRSQPKTSKKETVSVERLNKTMISKKIATKTNTTNDLYTSAAMLLSHHHGVEQKSEEIKRKRPTYNPVTLLEHFINTDYYLVKKESNTFKAIRNIIDQDRPVLIEARIRRSFERYFYVVEGYSSYGFHIIDSSIIGDKSVRRFIKQDEIDSLHKVIHIDYTRRDVHRKDTIVGY